MAIDFPSLAVILSLVNGLINRWQEELGSEVEIVLGGSLVSGTALLDDETKVIDVDVRFLVDEALVPDPDLLSTIESVTGLKYRKDNVVNDWPEGTSLGVMIEGFITLDGLPVPLEVEGCLRNRWYVGWHQYYQKVLTVAELEEIREGKRRLRNDKPAYKAFKNMWRSIVERRAIDRGLIS